MKLCNYNGKELAKFTNSFWSCPKCGYDIPYVKWAAATSFGGDKNILYVTCGRCDFFEECLTMDFEG
jgi:hypothetical protein